MIAQMKYKSKQLADDLYLHMKHMTLREASKKTKLSIATLSRIQNERMPSLLAYAAVCKFMGKSLDYYINTKQLTTKTK